MTSIAIIVLRNGELGDDYLLGRIASCWRESGMQVHLLRGPEATVQADLAILHVDLTAIPGDYLDLACRFPRTLNSRVTDISKRRISRNIVYPGDGYDGPVIVKTNRNCGGIPERRMFGRRTGLRGAIHGLRRRLPWAMRNELRTGEYRLFTAVRDVPRLVWLNSSFVVERFLPEVRDGYYCLRTWVFFGAQESNSLSYASEPIVKSSNVVRRELIPEVPDELREIRRSLGFDFGKFDYSIVDGRVVLYDTNRTPSIGSLSREQFLPQARHLAAGLSSFIDDPTSSRSAIPEAVL